MTAAPTESSSIPAVLAFDIGGTWVKYGVVDADGRLSDVDQVSTFGQDGGQTLLDRLLDVALPLVRRHAIAGVAFSTLGVIDRAAGRLVAASEAIATYQGLSPKERFESALGVPVVVENDGNCVALAEGWTGAAAGVRHYLALTLGTGIGGGIVIDGHLYRGANGAAGEWGYMRVDGRVWEDHASPRGLAAAADRLRPATRHDAEAVFAARDAGDAELGALVDAWFDLLATGLANLMVAFNPARVVIGGGITARGAPFLDELRAHLAARLHSDFHHMGDLTLASAGTHAGLLGAARLWFDEHAPRRAPPR